MSAQSFITAALETYATANGAALNWLLARPALAGPCLNTKMNSLTLADYGPEAGARGPGFTYGWIQGRGLEALATHAAFFGARDPALTAALDRRGEALYRALNGLQAKAGHGYFCYDEAMTPVFFAASGEARPQAATPGIFTFSDAFFAKGLIAGAARYAPADLPRHLDYLGAVIAAIEQNRFQMQEGEPLRVETAASQPADFGPRMILLGAARLLKDVGADERTGFAGRFIEHVLNVHFHKASGLLANVPGEDACNVGHGMEFIGFALDFYGAGVDPQLADRLGRILKASFKRGFAGPGVALSISIDERAPASPYCPWWSLPETIRAAALCYAATHDPECLAIWKQAHAAFFTQYWRGTPPIAYQTMTAQGPVDFVPATPDLDPGYHTGLSLLGAITAFA